MEIDSQFFGGLFTCPKCQAVYFIGFDGNPEQNVAHSQSNDSQGFSTPQSSQDFSVNPDQGSSDFSATSGAEPNMSTDSFQGYSSMGQQAENYPQMDQQGQESNQFGDPFAPLDSMPQEPMNPIQEIVNFGNNEVVDTAFSYRLLIRGLDITQNVDELKDILTDSKLGLNFEKLKSQIRKGELVIDKIDGAKAAIIAQRLRALPVEMVWEQKLYE